MVDKRPSCAKGRGYEYLGRKLFASIIKKHETSPSAEYFDDIEHEENINLPSVDRSSFIYGSGVSKKYKSEVHDFDDDLIESNLERRGSVGSFFMPNLKKIEDHSKSVNIDHSNDTENIFSKPTEPSTSTKKIIKTITKTSEITETRRASYVTKHDPNESEYETGSKTDEEGETYIPTPDEIKETDPNYKINSSVLSFEAGHRELNRPNSFSAYKDKDENKLSPSVLKYESRVHDYNDITLSKPPNFRKADENETDPFHSGKYDHDETYKQKRLSSIKSNIETDKEKGKVTSQTISFERHETHEIRRPSQTKNIDNNKIDEGARHHNEIKHHSIKPTETSETHKNNVEKGKEKGIVTAQTVPFERNETNETKRPSQIRTMDKNKTDEDASHHNEIKHHSIKPTETSATHKHNVEKDKEKGIVTSQTVPFEINETNKTNRPSQIKTIDNNKIDEGAQHHNETKHHSIKPTETSETHKHLENESLKPGTSFEKKISAMISKQDEKELKKFNNNDENDRNKVHNSSKPHLSDRGSIRNPSQTTSSDHRLSKSGIPTPIKGYEINPLDKNRTSSVVKPNVQIETHNIRNPSLTKSEDENKTNRFGYPTHTKDSEENQTDIYKPTSLVETNIRPNSFQNKSGASKTPFKTSMNSQIHNRGETDLDKNKVTIPSKYDDDSESKGYIKISPENTLMEKITTITPNLYETSDVLKLVPDFQERKKLLSLVALDSVSTNRQESLNNHLIVKGSSHLSDAPERESVEFNEDRQIVCDNTNVMNLLNKLLDEVMKISDFNVKQSKVSPVCHFYTDPKLELHKSHSKDLDKSRPSQSSILNPTDFNHEPNNSSVLLKLLNNADDVGRPKVSLMGNIEKSFQRPGSINVNDEKPPEKANFNELLNNLIKQSVSAEHSEGISMIQIKDQVTPNDLKDNEFQRALGSIVGMLKGVDETSQLKQRLGSIAGNDISLNHIGINDLQNLLKTGNSSTIHSEELEKNRIADLLEQVQRNPSLFDKIGNSKIRDKLLAEMMKGSLDPRGNESFRMQSITGVQDKSKVFKNGELSNIIKEISTRNRSSGQNQINQLETILKGFNGNTFDENFNEKATLQQLLDTSNEKNQMHATNETNLNISEGVGKVSLQDVINGTNGINTPDYFEIDLLKYGRKSNSVKGEFQELINNASLPTNSMVSFNRDAIDQLLSKSYKSLYYPVSGENPKIQEPNSNQQKDLIQQLINATSGNSKSLDQYFSSNEENKVSSDLDLHAKNKVQEFLTNDKSEIEKFINSLATVTNHPSQFNNLEPDTLMNIINKLSQDLGISDSRKVQELLNVAGKKDKNPTESSKIYPNANSDPQNFIISENPEGNIHPNAVGSDERSDLCGPGIDSDEISKSNIISKNTYEPRRSPINGASIAVNDIEKSNCSQLLESNRIYQVLTNLNGKQSPSKQVPSKQSPLTQSHSSVSKDCKNLIYEYSLKEIPLNVIIDYVQDKLSNARENLRPYLMNDNSTTEDVNNVWSKSYMSNDIQSSKRAQNKLNNDFKIDKGLSANYDNVFDKSAAGISDKKAYSSCIHSTNKKVGFADLEVYSEDMPLDSYDSNIKSFNNKIKTETKSTKDHSVQKPLHVSESEPSLQDYVFKSSRICKYCSKELDLNIPSHQHFDCPSLGIKSVPCYCRHNVSIPSKICNSELSMRPYCPHKVTEINNSLPNNENEGNNIPIYSRIGKKETPVDEDDNEDTEQLMQLCRKYLNKKTKACAYKTIDPYQKSEKCFSYLINSSDNFQKDINIPKISPMTSKVETTDRCINIEGSAVEKHKEFQSSFTTINTQFKGNIPSGSKTIVNNTQNCFTHQLKVPLCKDKNTEFFIYKPNINDHIRYGIDGYNNNVYRKDSRSNLWNKSLINENSKTASLIHQNCEGRSSLFLKNPQRDFSCESMQTSECDSKLLLVDCCTQTNNQKQTNQTINLHSKVYKKKTIFPHKVFKHESSQANFPTDWNKYNFHQSEIPVMYNLGNNLKPPNFYGAKVDKEFSQPTNAMKNYFVQPLTNDSSNISSEESRIYDDPIPYCRSTNKQIITSNRSVQADDMKHLKVSQRLNKESLYRENFHYISPDYDTPIFQTKGVTNEICTNFPEYDSNVMNLKSVLNSPSSHLFFDVKTFINRSGNNLLSTICKQSKSTDTPHEHECKPNNVTRLINKFTQCSLIPIKEKISQFAENVYEKNYFSNPIHKNGVFLPRNYYESSFQKKEIDSKITQVFQNIRKTKDANFSKDNKTTFTNRSTLLITSPRQQCASKSFSTQIRLIPLDSQRFCRSFKNQDRNRFSIATQTLSVSVCSISDSDISSRSELSTSSTDGKVSSNFGGQSNLYKFSSDSIIV